jgi:hypothetical protein
MYFFWEEVPVSSIKVLCLKCSENKHNRITLYSTTENYALIINESRTNLLNGIDKNLYAITVGAYSDILSCFKSNNTLFETKKDCMDYVSSIISSLGYKIVDRSILAYK